MSSKRLVLVVFVFFLGSIGLYLFIAKDHRNIEVEDVVYAVSAKQLMDDFENNHEKAILKYSNQTITVSGVAKQVSNRSLVFHDKIHCSFNDTFASVLPQSLITVKGRCVGFDDLLGEIKLDQCNFVSNE
jgi:hypothetical protein